MNVTAFKRKLLTQAQLAEESAKRTNLARQRNQERHAMRLAEAKEAEWHGVSVFLLRRIRQGPLLLPLAAYYTQDEEREAARAKFYAACARPSASRAGISTASRPRDSRKASASMVATSGRSARGAPSTSTSRRPR